MLIGRGVSTPCFFIRLSNLLKINLVVSKIVLSLYPKLNVMSKAKKKEFIVVGETPRVSVEMAEQIQGLQKKLMTPEHVVFVGQLFETEFEKVMVYPVLFSVEFFKALKKSVLELIPNTIIVVDNMFDSDGWLYIEHCPKDDYPRQKTIFFRNKIKWEDKNEYAKRLLQYCIDNQFNIVLQKNRSVFQSEFVLY